MKLLLLLFLTSAVAFGNDDCAKCYLKINVIGYMRSGNHAIIRSIALAASETNQEVSQPTGVLFFNNVSYGNGTEIYTGTWPQYDMSVGGRFIPTRSKAPFLVSRNLTQWGIGIEEKEVNNFPTLPDLLPRIRIPLMRRQEAKNLDSIDMEKFGVAIFSVEDMPPEKAEGISWEDAPIAGIHEKEVIIMRDPYNWMASRQKMGMPVDDGTIEGWKTWAQKMEASMLMPGTSHKRVFINYNQWVKSPAYRESVGKELGFSVPLPVIKEVPKNGLGSSFDKLKFNGTADKMKVLERWKSLKEDRRFQVFMKDTEIRRLSISLFGVDPLAP